MPIDRIESTLKHSMSTVPSIATPAAYSPQVTKSSPDVDGDRDGSKGPDPTPQSTSPTPHLPNPTATLGNSVNTHA